jgi:hypothetical protein
MSWGTVQIGRLTLREGFELSESASSTTGGRAIRITGQESSPPLSLEDLRIRRESLSGLADGQLVPVIFRDKSDHDGWYIVTEASAEVANWTNEVVRFNWTLGLDRLGPENAIDVESRLTGVGRQNAYGLAGERWHAPAGLAYGYYTGAGEPSGSVNRPLADGGTITVHRGIPASVSPRWGSTLGNYGLGRARVMSGGHERVGRDVVLDPDDWSIGNGIVSFGPGASSSFTLSAWDGTAWDPTDWNVSVTGTTSGAITSWESASIIRNGYELCTVRLVKTATGGGRLSLDITLRRGARFVETYLQSSIAGTKAWYLATPAAGSAPPSSGYVVGTANDAGGNRYLVTSAMMFAAQTTQGGLSASATPALDAGIGVVLGGSGAAAGDMAPTLRDHYLRTMAESTVGIIR